MVQIPDKACYFFTVFCGAAAQLGSGPPHLDFEITYTYTHAGTHPVELL